MVKRLVLVLVAAFLGLSALGDTFYEYKNGKRYFCQLDQEPPGKCEYIAGNVYCPGPGEKCSYIAGNVYCGTGCEYIAGNVYCARFGEKCSYISGNVYCGLNCEYIAGNVHCSTGGLAKTATPAKPNKP